jgi:hypothetical protein
MEPGVHDIPPPAADHSVWHACIAAVVLVVLFIMFGGCGDEDFTIGGPLPSRPTGGVTGTVPSATPDEGGL